MIRLEPGTVIGGRYRLERKLGEGGYALVFAARDLANGSEVAIKLLGRQAATRSEGVARFEREARIIRELTHPNIVQTLGLGRTEDGIPFLVLELLRGETVGARLAREGRLAIDETARIGREMLRALAVAHERGIVHRDIKPENIFLCTVPDGPPVARLLDFGVAHLNRDDGPTLTRASTVLGTPAYMAPEQVLGEPIDGATDLYALGLVLAECIDGAPVMTDSNPVKVALRQAATDPVPLSMQVRSSPLASAIVKATEKDRTKRPKDALAMLELFPAHMSRPLSELETAPTAIAAIPDEISHDGYELPEPPTVRGATPAGGVSSLGAARKTAVKTVAIAIPAAASGSAWSAAPSRGSGAPARPVSAPLLQSTNAQPSVPTAFEPAPTTARLPEVKPPTNRALAIVGAAILAAIVVAVATFAWWAWRTSNGNGAVGACNLSDEDGGPRLGGSSFGEAAHLLSRQGFGEDAAAPRGRGMVSRTFANPETHERIVILATDPAIPETTTRSAEAAAADADGCRISVVRMADVGTPRETAEATLKDLFPAATRVPK